MRITVELKQETLDEVMSLTGETIKSSAVAKAAEEFVRRRKAAEFGRLIRESAFDYPDPTEEASGDPVPPLRSP